MSKSMTKSTSTLVTGVFKNRAAFEEAVRQLLEMGYSPQDISVIMSDETRTREFGIEPGTKAAEGAGIGGGIGAALGAVLAAVAAVGTSIVFPGLGLIVAGPLLAALAGAGAGGVTGGLVGALVGAGIPEYRAKAYDKALHAGGILVGVEAATDEDVEIVEELFENLGAEQVSEE